jgi:hypothetical protein
VFTVVPPFLLSRQCRRPGGPRRPFEIESHELVLGGRESEPADVVDGATSVEQQNDRIFPVEKLLELFVQTRDVLSERLSKGHVQDPVAAIADGADPLVVFPARERRNVSCCARGPNVSTTSDQSARASA